MPEHFARFFEHARLLQQRHALAQAFILRRTDDGREVVDAGMPRLLMVKVPPLASSGMLRSGR